MKTFNRLILMSVITATVSACIGNQKHAAQDSTVILTLEESSARDAELVVQHFANDFVFACVSTLAQPEMIRAAAEDLAWREEPDLTTYLPDITAWSSKSGPFEPPGPGQTPVFRLWVTDYLSLSSPHSFCMLQMPTAAADNSSLLEEVEYFRIHLSKSFEIGTLTEDQMDDPRLENQFLKVYSFQINIADNQNLEVSYQAVTDSSRVAIHVLTAKWSKPIE